MTSHTHQIRQPDFRAGRTRPAVVIALVLLLLAGGGVAAGLLMLPGGERIAAGVTFRGVYLDDLQPAEAREAIETTTARVTDRRLALRAGHYRRETTLAALGMRHDTEAVLARARAVGRDGSLPWRVIGAARARLAPIDLEPVYALDDAVAAAYLADFAARIDRKPADATVRWDVAESRLVVTPEVRGAALDESAALDTLRTLLPEKLAAGEALPRELSLPYRERSPRVTERALAEVDTVLGEYTTSYATSSANRAGNVELAARAMTGTVVLPGEVFSYNDTVGPRTAAAGFREAPVISNGQLTPGMGGGICQVSTTLYNAVLLAGLDIVARSHHSLPIHYAPPGRDATVAYRAIDFKFRNTTGAPVVVDASYAKRRLTLRILGKGPAPEVRIEVSDRVALPGQTITRKDPTLPAGQRVVESRGTAGLAVTVTRVFDDGARREVLSRDRYKGEPTIVRVGSGPAVADAASSATATAVELP